MSCFGAVISRRHPPHFLSFESFPVMSRSIPKEQLRELVGRPLQPFFVSNSDADRSDWGQNDTGQDILVREWCNDGYFHHPQNIQAAQTRHSQSAQPSQPVAPSYPSYSNHQQPQSDDLPSYRTKPKAKKSTEAEYDAFVDMNGLANDLPSYSQSSNPAPQHSVTQAAQKPKNKTPKTATPQYPKSNNSKGSNVKASGNYCMPDFLSSAPAPESLPMPSFAPTSTPTQVKSPPFAPTPKQLHFVSPPQTASPTAVNAFLSTLPISVTKPQPPPQSPPQYKPAAPSQSNVRPMQQMPVVPQVVRPPVVTSAPQAVAVAPVAAPATASAAPQLILRKQGRVEVVALK